MQSDDELVHEIRNGNQAAMEVLVQRHYKFIYSIVYRKTGDYHSSCDLTQEIFVKIIKSIDKYQLYRGFAPWIASIALNHCTDYFRSSSFKEKQALVELAPNILDDTGNVVRLLEWKDDRARMKQAILDLPDRQRDVILLNYYHGMKIRDIASITNSNESTVKSRLHQGLRKLRKLLERGTAREDEQGQI